MAERKNNLSDEIFEKMKQMLTSGQWRPGERLPSEKELMEIYQASRVSIRGPLKQLASLGLVETRKGAGTFVRCFNEETFTVPIQPMLYTQVMTKESILNIMEARSIEIMIAGLAAERSNDNSMRILAGIYEEMKREAHDAAVHQKSDLEFHLQICRMAENPLLFQICKLMFEALERALTYTLSIMGPQSALYYHARLMDTIACHYVHEAKATMEEHLLTAIEAVKAIPEDSEIFSAARAKEG